MSHPKHASSEHDILDVIRRRWSPRAFDVDREVSLDDLRTMFEAARWAPSSFNEQPWRFVVADRRQAPDAFGRLLATLETVNAEWARHAPVLVLVAVSTRLRRTGSLNQSAWYDAGQAVGYLTLQATGLGLALRQMEGFNRDTARAACDIPADYEPLVIMAVGYEGDPDALASERDRANERRPRQRAPSGEFVYDGVWGKSLT